MSAPPEETVLTKSGFPDNYYYDGAWEDPDMTLPPGEIFLISKFGIYDSRGGGWTGQRAGGRLGVLNKNGRV